jgi:hypothetical protein
VALVAIWSRGVASATGMSAATVAGGLVSAITRSEI